MSKNSINEGCGCLLVAVAIAIILYAMSYVGCLPGHREEGQTEKQTVKQPEEPKNNRSFLDDGKR